MAYDIINLFFDLVTASGVPIPVYDHPVRSGPEKECENCDNEFHQRSAPNLGRELIRHRFVEPVCSTGCLNFDQVAKFCLAETNARGNHIEDLIQKGRSKGANTIKDHNSLSP